MSHKAIQSVSVRTFHFSSHLDFHGRGRGSLDQCFSFVKPLQWFRLEIFTPPHPPPPPWKAIWAPSLPVLFIFSSPTRPRRLRTRWALTLSLCSPAQSRTVTTPSHISLNRTKLYGTKHSLTSYSPATRTSRFSKRNHNQLIPDHCQKPTRYQTSTHWQTRHQSSTQIRFRWYFQIYNKLISSKPQYTARQPRNGRQC